MRQRLLLIFVAAGVLAACTSPPPQREPVQKWDYEIATGKGRAIGAAVGALMGGAIGRNSARLNGGLAGGVISTIDGIGLSPPALREVFIAALNGVSVRARVLPAKADAAPPLQKPSVWTIAESTEGQLVTDWKPIPGRTVGVAWWKKEYQARVRHIVTVKHSFRSSDRSNYAIDTEVQERPNDQYPWVAADPELGRQSFEDIKGFLLNVVESTSAKGKK